MLELLMLELPERHATSVFGRGSRFRLQADSGQLPGSHPTEQELGCQWIMITITVAIIRVITQQELGDGRHGPLEGRLPVDAGKRPTGILACQWTCEVAGAE